MYPVIHLQNGAATGGSLNKGFRILAHDRLHNSLTGRMACAREIRGPNSKPSTGSIWVCSPSAWKR